MSNLSKLSLTAGALALSAAALAPFTSALAADMPMGPPQAQGEFQPPPSAYYPPPVVQGYPPPPVVYHLRRHHPSITPMPHHRMWFGRDPTITGRATVTDRVLPTAPATGVIGTAETLPISVCLGEIARCRCSAGTAPCYCALWQLGCSN